MGLFSELFKPAWQGKNTDKAIAAVKKLTDQNEIARAAKEAPWFLTRKAAIEKLADQTILADIAIKDINVGDTAVERLTDQTELIRVVKNCKDQHICMAAAEKLTDQALAQGLFAILAKNDKDWTVRKAAVNRLTVKTVLADIAKDNNEKIEVAMEAVKRLTDQALLADVAKYGSGLGVDAYALSKITDKDILQETCVYILKNEKSTGTCTLAIEKINNQDILIYVVKNSKMIHIRKAALKKITDRQFLNEIINDKAGKYIYTDHWISNNSSDHGSYETDLSSYAHERLNELDKNQSVTRT
jgi:hypothetical protein